MSVLTAASERSSSGLSVGVSGPSFFGTSSFSGVALVLLAMSLSTARAASRSYALVAGAAGAIATTGLDDRHVIVLKRRSAGRVDLTATRTDRLVRFSARGGSDQDRRRRDRPDRRGGRRSITPGDRQYRTEIIPLTRSGCNRVALRIRVLSLRRGS